MSAKARIYWRVVLISIAFVVLGWLFWRAQAALTPFIIGLVIAFVLMPLVDALNRFLPRALAILLVYILIIAAIASFFVYLVPIIVDQINAIINNKTNYIADVQKWLNDTFVSVEQQLPTDFQKPVTAAINTFPQNALNFVQTLSGGIVNSVFGLVFGTIGFLVGILIIPFWMFYVIKDKARGMRLFYSIISPSLRDDAHRLISIVSDGLNNYVRGQLLVAGSVGVLATIGLMVIGFTPNSAIFLGFIAGLFEVLPIVGPILGAIPSLIVAFFYGGQVGNMEVVLRVVIIFIIVQQIEGNLLVPKIAGDSTKLHPAIVMLVIIVGSEVAGLVGAIVSVPLTAVGRDVYVYLYQRLVLVATPEQAEAKVPSKRDEIAAKIYRQEQRRLKRRQETEQAASLPSEEKPTATPVSR